MRKVFFIGIVIVLAAVLTAPAYAQGSDNFSASATAATYPVGSNGALTGGTGMTLWSSNISASNGSGTEKCANISLFSVLFEFSEAFSPINTQVVSSLWRCLCAAPLNCLRLTIQTMRLSKIQENK